MKETATATTAGRHLSATEEEWVAASTAAPLRSVSSHLVLGDTDSGKNQSHGK